jgi:hypothetical protein
LSGTWKRKRTLSSPTSQRGSPRRRPKACHRGLRTGGNGLVGGFSIHLLETTIMQGSAVTPLMTPRQPPAPSSEKVRVPWGYAVWESPPRAPLVPASPPPHNAWCASSPPPPPHNV